MCNIYITNRPPMCAYNCVQTLHSKSIVFYIIINISSWVSVSSRACVNVLFELQFCTSWTFQVDKKTLQLASCNNSIFPFWTTKVPPLTALVWQAAGGERKHRYLRKTAAKQLRKQTFWQINPNCGELSEARTSTHSKTSHLFVEGDT